MSWQIKQRVNFYTDEFKPPQLPDEIARLLLISAALMSLMLVVFVCAWSYSGWQGRALDNARQQQAFLQQQLETIKAERPPLIADSGLEQQKQLQEQRLVANQKILRYLTQGQLEQSHSFTPMVEQLGEQDIKGVWLQSFVIDEQGQRIGLNGYVDDPAKLSPYISSLVNRSAYKNRAFRFIDLQKNEGNSWLKFELDTRARDEQEKNDLIEQLAVGEQQ